MTSYWAYKCASWLSRLLPSAVAYGVGVRLADIFYWRDHEGRCAVVNNLRRIHLVRGTPHSDESLSAMARDTYRHFGKYLVDFFRIRLDSDTWSEDRVRMVHEEYLARAVAAKKGIVLVTAHFGNWELGGAVLASRGHDVHAVVLPYRSEKIERLFNHYREQRGIHTIPFGRAVRELIRFLQAGKMVALLADRDFSSHQHESTLFGASVSMPRGPSWLSIQTGAPILPAFMVRQPDDTFVLRFHPPLFPEELKTEEQVCASLCGILEAEIAEQPQQWFIFEDFWNNDGRKRGHRHE